MRAQFEALKRTGSHGSPHGSSKLAQARLGRRTARGQRGGSRDCHKTRRPVERTRAASLCFKLVDPQSRPCPTMEGQTLKPSKRHKNRTLESLVLASVFLLFAHEHVPPTEILPTIVQSQRRLLEASEGRTEEPLVPEQWRMSDLSSGQWIM